MRLADNRLHWSIDALTVRENLVFGFGWVFHDDAEVSDVCLCLRRGRGGEWLGAIPVEGGKNREDVNQAFGDRPRARGAGFMIYGAFPEPVGPKDQLVLTGRLSTGEQLTRVIPAAATRRLGGGTGLELLPRLRKAVSLAQRGVRTLARGDGRAFVSGVQTFLNERPHRPLTTATELFARLTPGELTRVTLIVDHELGGGANRYRFEQVEGLLAQGRTVVLWTYRVNSLATALTVVTPRLTLEYAVENPASLLEVVGRLGVERIVYNNGVSFRDPELLPGLMLALRQQTGARLEVLLHDFFVVCPSQHLLDDSGKFCGVPELATCERCLPRNTQAFATLFGPRQIAQWRAAWGSLLEAADEVVAFSSRSQQLLLRAYPHLSTAKLRVVPHALPAAPSQRPRLDPNRPLSLGVVGHITRPKGAAVVRGLAEEIERRGLGLPITVIGTLDGPHLGAGVRETGPYRAGELPERLSASGVNVVLFPSIVPETYSYVMGELMQLEVPVAGFDLGAQGERLSSYAKGCVLSSTRPSVILDELLPFHRRLAEH